MRPGLNLAISTIRAWNDIGLWPRIVAPSNSTRTQIVFHNPGCVDVLIAPVVVVDDHDTVPLGPPPLGAPFGGPQSWPFDWPFDPGSSPLLPPMPRPIDSPPVQVSNRPLRPSPSRRGGCILVYGNGGDCVISGNVTMAWQAFALDEPATCGGGCMTVVGSNPPSCPMLGQLWWDTNDGQLYVWIGTAWVAASCCPGGGSGSIALPGPTPPGPVMPPPLGHPLTVIELT